MAEEDPTTRLEELPGKPGSSDEIVYWVLEELKNQLDQTQQGVLELTKAQERLEEQLAEPEEPAAPKFKPVSWSFRDVTGPARRELWETLLNFVDWINARYFPSDTSKNIPGCWIFHGVVVEELTGVWAAWHAAMRNHDSPNSDYAAWHRLYFWPAMHMIEQELKDCRGTSGHEHSPQHLPERDPGLEDFLNEDCAEHADRVDRQTGEIREDSSSGGTQ